MSAINIEVTKNFYDVTLEKGYYPLPGGGGGGGGDLSNYYTKSETYSKTEVDDIISDIPFVDTSNLVTYIGANKDVNIGSYYFESSAGFKKTGGTSSQYLMADGSVSTLPTDLAFKSDIDNLQIGGRNLILNSELKGVISGLPSLELSEPLIAGQEYTLSFTAKKEASNSDTGWVSVQRINDWTAEQLNIRITLTDSEYKEYKATFIAKSTAIEQKIWVYSHDTYKIDFKKGIKLEKGNKATDWTPAPEDKQDRLQDVTGNIGVGKSDASATEKLDVNGKIKDSQGILKSQRTITITGNTTLSETHNGAVLNVTNTCTITIPTGLDANFQCVVFAKGSVIVTFVNGGVTVYAPSGLLLKTDKMASLISTATNNFNLTGELATS